MLTRRNNNGLTTYNPFQELDNFERNFFGDFFPRFDRSSLASFKTDITDEGDSYKIEADLPGFKKEDIHLDVSDNILTLSAERHSEHEDKEKNSKYLRCERSYGSYSRSFDLSDVKSEDITAKYEDGVLTLNLPKKTKEVPASRRIELQ